MADRHAIWRQPMPIDKSAMRRALIWSCAVIAAAIGVLYIIFWDPDVIWLVTLLAPLIWPTAVSYERKRTVNLMKPALWAKYAQFDDEDVTPVVIEVRRGIWFVGYDVVLLNIQDHRMSFDGVRSAFDLHRQDLEMDGENAWVVMDKNCARSDLLIDVEPLSPPGAGENQRIRDHYVKLRDLFFRSFKSKEGESVLPPDVPFSPGDLGVSNPWTLLFLAIALANFVRLPLMIMKVDWRYSRPVLDAVVVLALVGLWLYLRRARSKAIEEFCSGDRRQTLDDGEPTIVG